MSNDTSNKIELKVVLLGSVGVGKTSTVLRFVKNNFKEYLETTVGASYMSKSMTVDNVSINYNVWDTGKFFCNFTACFPCEQVMI